jgi:hypothetical protein
MTPSDAAIVLALCATYDRRTIGRADATAWGRILGDAEVRDALQAVDDWYAQSRDWIMPADVIAGAKRLRDARLAAERRAALDAQIKTENNIGELHNRPVAALTAGQPIPIDDPVRAERRRMLAKAAHTKQAQIEADTQHSAEHRARREQAQRELDALRAAEPTGETA